MTITISVDQASIAYDADRAGVDFSFSDGMDRHRVHVPGRAIADHLRVGALSPVQAEGFVRSNALRISLVLAGELLGRGAQGETLASLDVLRRAR
jgi:hypothetical protein